MNILFICDYKSNFEGAFIRSLKSLSLDLYNNGYSLYYIFPYKRDYHQDLLNYGEIHYVTTFSNCKFSFKFFLFQFYFIKKNKINIVHTNFGLCSFLTSSILSKLFGFIHISHERALSGYDFKNMKSKKPSIRKLVFQLIDLFSNNLYIAVSDKVKDSLINYCGYNYNNIKVIYNSVTIEDTLYEEDKKKIEFVKAISKKNYIIGMVAQFESRKNHFIIVDAVKSLVNKYPNLRIIFIGKARDRTGQDYINKLKNKIKNRALDEYFVFLGTLKNPNNVVNFFDIGLLMSNWEGFGNVIIEYMLAQKPVIASNVGGIVNIIDHGENGFLVDNENPQELSKFINIIFEDIELSNRMSKKAFETAFKRYNQKKWNKSIMELYERNLYK